MRVLIATATAGGGHLQAAAAMDEAWQRLRPQDTVKRVDILDFTPRLYRKAYAEGYVKIAEKLPELYAHAFRVSDNPVWVRKFSKFRRLSARWVTRKFIRTLNAFKPDVVICPHFLPLETMGALDDHGLKIRRPHVICIVTDFEAHALWMEPCVDLYCVAMESTKALLVARGIPKNKIIVTGIPVSERFLKPTSRARARRELHLDLHRPGVLVLGGGLGMGPLGETVRDLDHSTKAFQMIVVAGKNEALRKKLAARRYKHPTRVFGFVTNMQTLMAAADVVVTKPGGLTTSEALALGKPLLIVNPLPGQEAANSDFLLQNGAAVKASRLEDLSYKVDQLFQRGRLAALSRAAKKWGRPNAAMQICRHVVGRFGTTSKRRAAVLVAAVALLLPVSRASASCGLEKNEAAFFYPTVAVWNAPRKAWIVTISGWVYEPARYSRKRQALLEAFIQNLGLSKDQSKNSLFRTRAELFLADDKARKLSIQIAGKTFDLPVSESGGYVETEVTVPELPRNQWTSYATPACERDGRSYSGKVWAAGDQGLLVISDMDDTLKVTGAKSGDILVNTFLKEYRAIPGMSKLFRRWSGDKNTLFCYVTASPWQLFTPLTEFLNRNDFPEGFFYLKRFHWNNSSFWSLFESPGIYKRPILEKLLAQFPSRKAILLGDTLFKDPEVYGEIARAYGSHIEHIYIRQVGMADEDRLNRAFSGIPRSLWTSFRDAGELL